MNPARSRWSLLFCLFSLLSVSFAGEAGKTGPKNPRISDLLTTVDQRIEASFPQWEALYRQLHLAPELSLQEFRTADRLARELTSLGFQVTPKVGGTGLAAVFANGKGPTVLVRCDMDALPVTERTGLPYASTVRTRDKTGREVGVMHACGHDLHMTAMIGTARVLTELKDRWKGTLLFIAQPAEEIGVGARAMLEDGLFKRFPRPDVGFALHCDAQLPHGSIAFTEGLALANVDTVDLVVRGKGGHGAAPHTTVDPIVLAARIILDLQTLVSRETNPTDPSVVTVGSIHGGTKHNIIPDEVRLQLTVRSTKDSVRNHLLRGIRRIAEGCAMAANAPKPTITVSETEFTPAMLNDSALTRKTVALFREILGADKVEERPPVLGGEDFSRFGRAGVPVFLYFLGTIDPDRYAASKKEGASPLPSLHSDQYAPIPGPSIRVGVRTMSMAVLQALGAGEK